ncbi:acyltransferase [Limosilactobacillus vaginalis]|uniref:acyltransferase n=1 Tax=Limosilactobacillus vaginalis TaxID=1633 RepID=UPI0021B63768|nr:acyltransferase [Limosilactobacillus vaginalis]UXC68812.1 acyltransferase [Limosilactobacillus vaginalis]
MLEEDKLVKERNYGVDLLRIISMYMIMTLHVMSNGGSLLEHQVNTYHTQVILLLTFFNNVAVNLFALISGYVGIKAKRKAKRIIELWLQVLFFSWGIMLFFLLFLPQYLNHFQELASIFPTLSKQYWYFNAYLLLFILMPIINNGIKKLNKSQFSKLCLLLFIITSCIGGIFYQDSFALNNGFSGIWLIIMYIFGAYLKQYGLKIKPNLSLLMYLMASILGAVIVNLTVIGSNGYSSGKVLYDNWFKWFNYNNPIMVINAILLFWVFVNINIKGRYTIGFIEHISTLAFGTYLLQTNYIVYAWFKGRYAYFYDKNILFMLFLILLTALGWFILGSIVEAIRQYAFRKLKIVSFVTKLLKKPMVHLKMFDKN